MGYMILFGFLILLPLCVGGLFRKVDKNTDSLSLGAQWMYGQFLLWAVFQLVTVYFILTQGILRDVMWAYTIAALLLGISGLLAGICMWIKEDKHSTKSQHLWTKEQKLMAGIFVILWLVQMIGLLFLAVNDGDDAFYMAVAERARESGALYTANVYSFGYTELNYRYALAPFPIWIAFLAKISGVHTLTIGHIILGILLVSMSYVAYAQMGKILFGDDVKKRLQMLILVAVLHIWGNTSSHTAESFLLLRTRQGKALVAGLVFPVMIYVILKIGKALEQQRKIPWDSYLLAMAVILTGCLGSTLGGALVILLWASAMLLLAAGYKKWSLLPLGALSALPGFLYAILYLIN